MSAFARLEGGRGELIGGVVRRIARGRVAICLSPVYLELRDAAAGGEDNFFLYAYRGDWPNFEPSAAVEPFLAAFLHGPEPYILKAVSILRKCS